MKVFLYGFVAFILALGIVPKAEAQIRIGIGHRRYYHHRYYRHHRYHRHYRHF